MSALTTSNQLPFKRRLQHLPTPLADDVLAAFAVAAERLPAAPVDLWEDEVVGVREKIDTTRLYQPIFDKQAERFTAVKGFEMLAPLSFHVRNKVQNTYQQRVNSGGIVAGSAYLRETIKKLTVVWHKYPFFKISGMKFVKHSAQELDDNEDLPPESRALVAASPFSAFRLLRHRKSTELKQVASQMADACMVQVKAIAAADHSDMAYFNAYDAAAELCKTWSIEPPYWQAAHVDHINEAAECAILRMTCPKWWGKKLLKLRDQCCEHLCLAVGLITQKTPFISDECFSEWQSQQKTAMQWLESTMIENDDGIILPLIEAAMAGNANPTNRVTELIVRNRGLEEIADAAGMIALAVTLTCPSKYHSNSHKWDLGNAKRAQKYLVNTFAKMRSALGYRNIPFLGFRVAEPHKDSTPHWHMAWVIKPEHEAAVKDIITKYAYQVDGDEPGAAEHRLKIEPVRKDANGKSGLAGYFIKYLLKGIPGDHMHGQQELELESGQTIEAASARIAAWASRYGIRQYQFYGAESVQIWRELRRLKVGPQSPEIEAVRAAACSSDWKGYEEAMKHAQLSLNYELTPEGNQYGEVTKRVQGISGIAFGKKRLIITRGERWKLRKANDDELEAYKTLKQRRKDLFTVNRAMNAESRLSRKELKDAMPKWSMALLPLPFGSPWTCRNNCTDPVLEEVDSRIIRHLAQVGITDPANIERLLFDGCRVMDADGGEWWVDNGQLRNEPYRYHEIRDLPLDELVAEMQSWPTEQVNKNMRLDYEGVSARLLVARAV
ncbi:replication endonuclease [Shewanella morhuae]|uniref:Bacteriophage replication gene A protein (GPA) n=1 Tax=Shewanella morhuae TaxID=365591 RepID=A0A380B5Z9_9GAMM|nr:replication endonuclease [Shewanella morhuae]SUI93607.1 Bacteriophage replication gene A protein (GPA) [Shewanella morhuae]